MFGISEADEFQTTDDSAAYFFSARYPEHRQPVFVKTNDYCQVCRTNCAVLLVKGAHTQDEISVCKNCFYKIVSTINQSYQNALSSMFDSVSRYRDLHVLRDARQAQLMAAESEILKQQERDKQVMMTSIIFKNKNDRAEKQREYDRIQADEIEAFHLEIARLKAEGKIATDKLVGEAAQDLDKLGEIYFTLFSTITAGREERLKNYVESSDTEVVKVVGVWVVIIVALTIAAIYYFH